MKCPPDGQAGRWIASTPKLSQPLADVGLEMGVGRVSGGKGSPGAESCPREDPGYELSLIVCFLWLLKTSGGGSREGIRLEKLLSGGRAEGCTDAFCIHRQFILTKV